MALEATMSSGAGPRESVRGSTENSEGWTGGVTGPAFSIARAAALPVWIVNPTVEISHLWKSQWAGSGSALIQKSCSGHCESKVEIHPLIRGTMAVKERKIRVLIAKPGLDGHDRGAKIIARALRDAGMEVIYTGLRQTPDQIVTAALQEDVDAIGLSILSGAHNTIVPRVMELLKANKLEDVLVVVGGIIPEQDVSELKSLGVAAVFFPGTTTEETIRFIQENVKARQL
jgi:methylmalonyl-CoA mutase, C-terminal domain